MNTSAPTRKQSWKDNVQKTRFVMDILLLVSFLIVLAPQSTGIVLHEWLSLVFFCTFRYSYPIALAVVYSQF